MGGNQIYTLAAKSNYLKECIAIILPVRKAFVYTIVAVVSISLAALEQPFIYAIITSFFIAVLLITIPFYYMMLFETRIDRIEKFLLKEKKMPTVYLTYAIANKLDAEVAHILEQLLAKYKQPQRQALYKAMYGVYRKDSAAVKSQLEYIRSPYYRHYYELYVYIEEGQLELARAAIDKLSKPWMKYANLAELEKRSGNYHEAVELAKKALHACKGLQKYVLYKNYERELPEALLSS